MHRIEVNVQTGEATQVELSAEEVTRALAQKAAWDAEQAKIVKPVPLEDIIKQLQDKITALETK